MGTHRGETCLYCQMVLDGCRAEVPTVVRDILYGWARGFVAVALSAVWKPQTFVQEAGSSVVMFAWHGWALLLGRPSCSPS